MINFRIMLVKIFSAIIIFFQSIFGLNAHNQSPISAQISNSLIPTIANETLLFLRENIGPTLPLKRSDADDLEINALSAIAFDTKSEKILYQKNIDEKLPIASLTKLMTADVFLENNNPEQIVTISKKSVETYGEMGELTVGEKIKAKDLLYILLMQSSNDAADALAENMEEYQTGNLVSLMNKKVKEIGAYDTSFIDPAGLDENNLSTALDLTKITQYAIQHKLILEILQTSTADILSIDGRYNHRLTNTNKFLETMPNVLGGKTGYTEEAGECMILLFQIPEKDNIIITIVLNAENRIKETEKLINWINQSYVF